MSVLSNRYDLLRTRLDRFTGMLHGVDADEVSAVHHARVASRRLRELLPILQLDSGVSERLGHRLRRATRRLGAIRELDVLLLLTEELRQSGKHSERALRLVAADVREARDRARGKLSGKRRSGELRRVARKLEKVGHQLEESERGPAGARAWRWVIAARVARRASTLKNAVEGAGALYLPERLHAARIAVKKLRYGMELATEAAGTAGGDDLRTLKRGQANLGRMHDLQVLIDRVRHIQMNLAPSEIVVSKDLDMLVIALDATCRRLHGRFVRDREALLEICRRLAARIPPQSKVAKTPGVRRAS